MRKGFKYLKIGRGNGNRSIGLPDDIERVKEVFSIVLLIESLGPYRELGKLNIQRMIDIFYEYEF